MSRERLLAGDVVLLDGPEGHHAATVRRLTVGETVRLVDGSGLRVDGEVTAVRRDELTVLVHTRTEEAPPQPRLVVVQALAKGDRGEHAVEGMSEVGVDEIVPWSAARSIVQWRDNKPLDRWRAKAREAAKQARRSWVPVITDPASTTEVADRLANATLAVVCHEGAVSPLTEATPPADGEIVLVVGPEGGLTDDELATFEKSGASAYSLGPSVLRTSTAGIVAAALLLSRTPRWKMGE
ncbi:MAG: rRNA (uracil1498-N3)-methyltransferase [Frankiales bacterium]|nr:rRNA (uracil1498-N3)-methyltransferase [Frankiales bacterium]